MNELVGGLGYAVKNWWMSLLLGLLYIAVALCLLFAPVSSYVALSVIFSISILVSGVLEVFFAAGNKKTQGPPSQAALSLSLSGLQA